MKRVLFGLMAFAAVAMFVASQGVSQSPSGKADKGGLAEKEKDGKESPKIEPEADKLWIRHTPVSEGWAI